MIRALFFVALAFAAVSAQRWPMITVNAAGEIVLQSLTRAQSFQLTPAAVTTGPSSSTASATSVTGLTAGVSVYVVTTATTTVTNHGVALPAPSVGATVTLLQSQTTFTSYTIWSSGSSVFINSDSTTVTFPALARSVRCTSVSLTRWNCVNDNILTAAQRNVITTSGTLTADQSGSAVVLATITATSSTSVSVTLPTCSTTLLGMYFDFSQGFSATTGAAANYVFTIVAPSGDKIIGQGLGQATAASAATTAYTSSPLGGSSGGTMVFTAAQTAAAATSGLVTANARCIAANTWQITGAITGSTTTLTHVVSFT
jgi:phage protein U